MKRQLFSFLLIFSFVYSVSAQIKESIKFDELESFYTCEDFKSRIDTFMSELQNQPSTRGYIIIYDGKYRVIRDTKYFSYPNTLSESRKWKSNLPVIGETVFRSQQILKHIKYRQFPAQRILVISGGYREYHSIEFWIVPVGTIPPKPSLTIQKIKYRKGEIKGIVCEEA